MKPNLFILFFAFVFVFSSNTSSEKTCSDQTKNDSIQVVLKPYKYSERIEYEIPILRIRH